VKAERPELGTEQQAGGRKGTLKETESSRKDELDPKRSRDGAQEDRKAGWKRSSQGGRERSRRFPACAHKRLRGATNSMSVGTA